MNKARGEALRAHAGARPKVCKNERIARQTGAANEAAAQTSNRRKNERIGARMDFSLRAELWKRPPWLGVNPYPHPVDTETNGSTTCPAIYLRFIRFWKRSAARCCCHRFLCRRIGQPHSRHFNHFVACDISDAGPCRGRRARLRHRLQPQTNCHSHSRLIVGLQYAETPPIEERKARAKLFVSLAPNEVRLVPQGAPRPLACETRLCTTGPSR